MKSSVNDKLNGQFQKLNAHPLKKTWESKKFYPHFSLGIKKKKATKKKKKQKKAFFGHKGKEDMGIPKFLISFSTKN